MKKVIAVLSIIMMSNLMLVSQVLDEEIGFRLVKADYLLNTERYEDAVRELNEVIKSNPAFKNALLLRAETKFKLAAFKGAKADAMEYINLNGITGRAAAVLGKAEHALNNQDPALNSISAAIALGEKEAKLYELRAEIYEIKGQKASACEDWQMAAKLGSAKGMLNARRVCSNVIDPQSNPPAPSPPPVTLPPATTIPDNEEPINTDNTTTDSTNLGSPAGNGEVVNTNDTKDTTTAAVVEDPTIPKEDDTIGEIVIDDELTLQLFGMGLGKRKLMEKPNILILSEKDGTVAIEICVNAEGRVSAAEFVGIKSTISQASLVSLALRKVKEMWFEPSVYTNQCGYVNFIIKGS